MTGKGNIKNGISLCQRYSDAIYNSDLVHCDDSMICSLLLLGTNLHKLHLAKTCN